MREERKKESDRKRKQHDRSIGFKMTLEDHLEVFKEEGESLDDNIENGFMIKCEGCNLIFNTDTFFKHASHAKKCKEVYGERLEIMKKEKRKKIRKISEQKNKASIQEYQSKYHAKKKDSIHNQKSQKFQDHLSKQKVLKQDKRVNKIHRERNEDVEKTIRKLINSWKECRENDVKELKKSDTLLNNATLPLEIFNMNEKVKETVTQYESKLENTIDEWRLRDRKKYNLALEQLFVEWKMHAKKIDHSFRDLEKATAKNLTCYQCIISETKCYPKCESNIHEQDYKIQKLMPYDFEIL